MSESRALSFHRSIVPPGDRSEFLARLRSRRAYFAAADCRFWAYEESDLAGAFVEFIEAADARTLERALATAPGRVVDAVRIYLEVELS